MSPELTQSLNTPRQLLEKLRVDFERMKREPMSAYAAFDFFVTAEHMPDWLAPKSVKFKEPLLQIVSHIANGKTSQGQPREARCGFGRGDPEWSS